MTKNKFLLTLSFSLLFQYVIQAQNDWVWVGPDSTSVNFVYAKDDTVYVRNAKNYRSIDGSQTWDLLDDTNPKFGGGFGIKGVYAKNSSIIYVMDYLGNPWKSINGGISWDTLLPEGAPWPEEAWIKKIYFSPHNHNVLFCIVREGSVSSIDRLYRTTNNGTTWENLGAFLGSSHGNELIFAFDPVDSMKLYVCGSDNYLNNIFFGSYDFGDSWTVLSESIFTTELIIDWANNNRIFALPLRSEDGGITWEIIMDDIIDFGLPLQPWFTSLLINPLQSNILYSTFNEWDSLTATPKSLGIYKTTDSGDTWALMEGSESIDLIITSIMRPNLLFYDPIKQNFFVGSKKGVYVLNSPVNVASEKIKPTKFELHQNYPNPFNPTTQISYQLPKDGFVNLVVYNALGQEVAKLVNQHQSVGKYSVQFNASNLPSGVYIYKLQAGKFSSVKKMMLTK